MLLTMGIILLQQHKSGTRAENKQRNTSDKVNPQSQNNTKLHNIKNQNHKQEFQNRNIITSHPQNLDPKEVCVP
jgi:hypothetical protein